MQYIYLLNTGINLVNEISDQRMDTIISVSIPAIISIIGFIMSTRYLKKSFQNELKRQRDNITLEKMSAMPYDVLSLLDDSLALPARGSNKSSDKQKKQEDNLKGYLKVMNTIYSYGSPDAIKIAAFMQQETYKTEYHNQELDHYKVCTLFILLATQIKYDVTGIAVSPELWFKMKFKDYIKNKNRYKNANNQLIEELHLKSEFKIN